jgi:hypothetical protein
MGDGVPASDEGTDAVCARVDGNKRTLDDGDLFERVVWQLLGCAAFGALDPNDVACLYDSLDGAFVSDESAFFGRGIALAGPLERRPGKKPFSASCLDGHAGFGVPGDEGLYELDVLWSVAVVPGLFGEALDECRPLRRWDMLVWSTIPTSSIQGPEAAS